MRNIDSLVKIRSNWLTTISHRLARGEGVRESFLGQLDRFFDLVQQAVETGDPAWLDPILNEWSEALTQTELEDRENALQPILEQLLSLTYEISRQELSNEDALELTGVLLPVYTHAFDYIARQETDYRIDHITRELAKAQVTLERLDRSKSDFISIAAHELKTPLTLIEGYMAMLREQIDGKITGDATGILLNGIDNGARRLREIVDDMIDVSLIDNNLLSIQFQPVWVNRILRVIVNEFEETVKSRKQNLTLRSFPGSSEMTFGDDERLYQAFRNVINNAIKFTPDGGKIKIDGRKLPGFVEVIIADTGIGIDPEDHLRIFEKFGRVGNVSLHSSGKTKFKGAGPGLGLPITKGIIEAHGGAIWVESEGYNEVKCPGTTFHILLPLYKDPPDDKVARLFGPLLEENSARINKEGAKVEQAEQSEQEDNVKKDS
jgi:signal transduction histidine kinase